MFPTILSAATRRSRKLITAAVFGATLACAFSAPGAVAAGPNPRAPVCANENLHPQTRHVARPHPPGTMPPYAITNGREIDDAVICLVNHYRAQNGLAALSYDAGLQDGAQARSDWAAEYGHACQPGEAQPCPVITPSTSTAPGFARVTSYLDQFSISTPRAVVGSWMANPSSAARILDPYLQLIGAGVTGTARSHGALGEDSAYSVTFASYPILSGAASS